jgi:uncharacterized membrane protein
LDAIELVIQDSEKRHSAELVFAVESRFSLNDIFFGKTSKQRALELFGSLGVWDTEENCGVLLYLLLVEKKIEIIADRGISRKIHDSDWDSIVLRVEENFKKGFFEKGIILAVAEISHILSTHFPATQKGENQLPDKPVTL